MTFGRQPGRSTLVASPQQLAFCADAFIVSLAVAHAEQVLDKTRISYTNNAASPAVTARYNPRTPSTRSISASLPSSARLDHLPYFDPFLRLVCYNQPYFPFPIHV